jgi:hypothetical protein
MTASDPMFRTGQAIHPRSTRKPVLHFLCMSDYESQLKLAAKGLAERDTHPMPNSVTTPEEFYEVMAAAVLEAIDLPALLERVARAELELEIIQEALREADIEAQNARHKPMSDGGSSEEPTILSILKGASSRGPMRTDNPRPGPLSREPEQSGGVDERRRLPAMPPRLHRPRETRPPPSSRRPPHRTRRVSRWALANHFHSLSWRKLLPLRSSLHKAGT